MFNASDTIVAIATPPGEGAIGIIRLSGSDAIAVADRLFTGRKLAEQPSHTLHFGRIKADDRVIDEVVVSLYRAPRSYTGEDTAEISCHGSAYVLQEILGLCTMNGARIARPGEFTLRAFLNGKLDLTQAEAVADLIASHNSSAHKAAMHNLRGGFSTDLKDMREQLIQFSALIELELDFSQEDVEFADRAQFYALIGRLTTATQQLVSSFQLGNAIKNGVSVAIVGKPNAGKSTLLNALLNEERAIVSEIAGTTRDTIEEALNINGILFRLVDTAGIRAHTADVIEQKGIERSREAISKADIVIHLFDLNEYITTGAEALQADLAELAQGGAHYIAVGNKADQADGTLTNNLLSAVQQEILQISAKNNNNVQQLKQRLYDMVAGGAVQQEGTVVTNSRHYNLLREVLLSLYDIKSGLDTNLSGDLIALDIRRCLQYLGELTGEITTEDKLDYIFSKFCIGK